MDYEPKDVIVLGAIAGGARRFDKIQRATRIDPKELDGILEGLERRGMIRVEEKKGWLGKKVEITATDKGANEVRHRTHELKGDWERLVQVYKSGDKDKMKEQMGGFRGLFPMMLFFGIADMVMFSMMFSMIGATMSDYVPADQMPEGADAGADGGDAGADGVGADGGGFDFDIGF